MHVYACVWTSSGTWIYTGETLDQFTSPSTFLIHKITLIPDSSFCSQSVSSFFVGFFLHWTGYS